LSVRIDSECRHCARPLQFTVDEELNYQFASPGASPFLFEPEIHWPSFTGANIIHDY
jgi:uncharacterized metal-binding protein YceD (DUF177 family)